MANEVESARQLTSEIEGCISDAEVCIIHSIVIDPSHRRHHIGSRLIEELVIKCRAENIGIIRALVREPNESLRLFTQQLGFHKSDVVNYDMVFETEAE